MTASFFVLQMAQQQPQQPLNPGENVTHCGKCGTNHPMWVADVKGVGLNWWPFEDWDDPTPKTQARANSLSNANGAGQANPHCVGDHVVVPVNTFLKMKSHGDWLLTLGGGVVAGVLLVAIAWAVESKAKK